MPANPDLLFGALAVKAGFITRDQLRSLIEEQSGSPGDIPPLPVGELCRKSGLLTPEQVERVLEAQRLSEFETEGGLFGVLAVRNEFASLEDVEQAVQEQREADLSGNGSARLGEILLEMGALTPQQVDALLAAQERLRRRSAVQGIEADSETRILPAAAEGHPPAGDPGAWLVQESGEGSGRAHPLGGKTLIGRLPTHDIPVADMGASRHHARIDPSPYTGKHVLADLESRNGTFVNGERLAGPRALRPGDRVRIGETVLRYAVGTGTAPAMPPEAVPASSPGEESRDARPMSQRPLDGSTLAMSRVGDAVTRLIPLVHPQRSLVTAAALLGLLSTFLPWRTGAGASVWGHQGPGWASFLLFAVALGLTLSKDRARPPGPEPRLAVAALGLLAALFALWRWTRVPPGGAAGIGVFLVLLSGTSVGLIARPFPIVGAWARLTGRRARRKRDPA